MVLTCKYLFMTNFMNQFHNFVHLINSLLDAFTMSKTNEFKFNILIYHLCVIVLFKLRNIF